MHACMGQVFCQSKHDHIHHTTHIGLCTLAFSMLSWHPIRICFIPICLPHLCASFLSPIWSRGHHILCLFVQILIYSVQQEQFCTNYKLNVYLSFLVLISMHECMYNLWFDFFNCSLMRVLCTKQVLEDTLKL